MGKLIGGWIAICIFSFIIYTPIHWMINSSDDAMEEMTFKDMIPSFSASRLSEQEYDRKIALLEEMDVDVDMELLDAIEDIDGVENVETTVQAVREGKLSKSDNFDRTVNRVSITFNDEYGVQYLISALMVEKSYLNFSGTELIALDTLRNSTKGNYSRTQMIDFFANLFHEDRPSRKRPVNYTLI